VERQLEPVVAETNANRERFEQFCRSLSADDLAAVVPGGTWRTQDYIAHLATIDLWVGEWFEHQADGRPWRPRGEDGGPFNIDTWNEARIVERRDAGLDDLLAEAAILRERLWAAVDRFSPEVLEAELNFRGRDITFQRYLQLSGPPTTRPIAPTCSAASRPAPRMPICGRGSPVTRSSRSSSPLCSLLSTRSCGRSCPAPQRFHGSG
jgi:hypothetical protein